MTTKLKIIIATVSLLTAFAVGRWASPTKIVTETKTVTVEKQVDKTDTKTTGRKKIIITQKPDGSKQTIITTDTSSDSKSEDVTNTDTSTDTIKTVTRDSSKVTISALGAIDIRQLSSTPTFGGMISKPIFGPLTVGLFGLNSGVVGASLGLTF